MSGRTWSPDDGLVSEMPVASRVPWSRRFVARMFQRLREGHVTLRDGWGIVQGGREDAEKQVQILIEDPRFYRRLVSGGGMGAAESYAQGEWSCADLTGLFRLLLRNAEVLGSVQQRRRGMARIIGSLRHWLKRNHRQGSRRNIHQHYDLGNEFFQLFLDETLNYSSAIFADPEQSLADASRNKMETICRKLELSPGDHVVEIGSGWGSLATWMAQQHGCRVTTTTISREQFRYVSELVERLGLADQVTVTTSPLAPSNVTCKCVSTSVPSPCFIVFRACDVRIDACAPLPLAETDSAFDAPPNSASVFPAPHSPCARMEALKPESHQSKASRPTACAVPSCVT